MSVSLQDAMSGRFTTVKKWAPRQDIPVEVRGGINLGQGHRDVAVCRSADVGIQPDLVLYRVFRPVADVYVGGSHLKDSTPVTQHVGKGQQLVGRGPLPSEYIGQRVCCAGHHVRSHIVVDELLCVCRLRSASRERVQRVEVRRERRAHREPGRAVAPFPSRPFRRRALFFPTAPSSAVRTLSELGI